ncbi:hypothetical protein FB45DRAFT_255023 [Roridomyces roridus]|uniref:Uncharacterized protein n=1 Tax=Roridomyces roridus TaxID=1738132 RepID=A0AAD7B9B0_9AGAR|nr:hypothetical protein FB45DRAFT_255023 [Roridomyces roridus]
MNGTPLHGTHARTLTSDDTEDSDAGETLLGKPGSAPAEMQYSGQRSTLSLSLHVALVAIQLLLLVVWHQEWEHGISFSVDQELRVARLVKGILTTFITLYSALLVFVTQSLALRRDLHTRQLLTATHDNVVAWSGLGSAVLRLWQQRGIPASPIGVLSALIYLAGIAVLHTAFPAVAAPQSIVVNQSVPISTQNLPAFDLSGVNETNRQDFLEAAGQYAGSSLAFLPFLTPVNTLGLHEATLYDVVEPNPGTGSVRVNATGFDISCGYIPSTAFNATMRSVNVAGTHYFLGLTDVGVIAATTVTRSESLPYNHPSPMTFGITFPSLAVFYTFIPVLDSNNNTAPWITLDVEQAVQVFRCSLTLVEQTVLVDSQSGNFTSFAFKRPIEKQTSTWFPFSGQLDNLSTAAFADGARGFLDIWEGWYTAMPEMISAIPAVLTVADVALMQQLDLYPYNITFRTSIYLHEVENQLAKIVASMFWTLGHKVHSMSDSMSSAQPFNVSLLAGQAIVSAPMILDHLDLNIVSIIECLLTSLILLGLSFRFCRLGREARMTKTKIDGLDMLQTIWLYRDHPELAASMEQVYVSTDVNLRRAAMVCVQLMNGTTCVREVSDSQEFGEISEDADEMLETTYPPDKPSKEQESLGSTWMSDLVLSLVSIILHLGLTVIHLILAVLCGRGLEHRITFSLAQQSFVAWLISTLATAFITIYTAVLVFLTQTLSIKRNLRRTQMLTVTHDTVAAWRGIGSALTSVFHQTPSLPAVVPVFLYLGGILILHITSPALFVVQVFNSTVPVPVRTQGIPAFAFATYEPSSIEARIAPLHSPLLYAEGALFYLPFVNSSSPVLGLEGGMLYDVLYNSNSSTGIATVNAVQFNMSCGYYTDPVINSTARTITILGSEYWLSDLEAGIISTLEWYAVSDSFPSNFSIAADTGGWPIFTGSALFYSTIPISDSAGNTGPLVDISGVPSFGGASKAQIFGCSLGLVNGSVIVDSQSRLLSEWAFQKDSSVWSPFHSSKVDSTDAYDVLVNDWDSWYSSMPGANLPGTFASQPISDLSVADLFFVERLHLNFTGVSVTLHQFENALAELVASMYWTLGHMPPLPGFVPTSLEPNGPPPMEVSLLQGNTVFFADIVEARLDANMSFIILGTVVSAVLFLLSLHFSVFRTTEDEEIISGMGPLHIIWLYRNHPELEEQLEQVVDPTTSNLRKAGMVRTRLAGPKVENFME